MAFHPSNRTAQKCLTGSFHWNLAETKKFFSSEFELEFPFKFSGFDCYLCTVKHTLGNYTRFYMKSKFPYEFSSFYKFSVIDCDGKEHFTAKGRICNKPSETVLMIISDRQKNLVGKEISLRLSWFEDERYGMSEEEKSTLETLSRDFGRFYESKTNTDCVLRIGEAQFPVHRQVLAARSTVFEAMFHHDTLESRSGIVDITDIQSDVMNDVIIYIYTGNICNLTTASVVPMYVVADKYALIELRNKCVDFLQHSLTLENVCDAAVLAHNYGESELENTVISFIEERLEELMGNENWKSFLKNNSALASKLLCSALLTNKMKTKMILQ